MKKLFVFQSVIWVLLVVLSCTHEFNVIVEPADAAIVIGGTADLTSDGVYSTKEKEISVEIERRGYEPLKTSLVAGKLFGRETVRFKLNPLIYPVTIDTVHEAVEVFLEGEYIGTTPVKTDLAYGKHNLALHIAGEATQDVVLTVDGARTYLVRYQGKEIPIDPFGIFECGELPKQTLFTPDDKDIYIPLLADSGFDIFNMEDYSTRRIRVGTEYRQTGFVEGLFIPEEETFWISQMTTAKFYEYDISDRAEPELVRELPAKGLWTKFIAYDRVHDYIAVSNWSSNDVTIFNKESGELVARLSDIRAPRGIIFSGDGKWFYVASFEGGEFLKYSTEDWKVAGKIYKKNAAMRHVVLTKDEKTCFVSNMYHFEIYEIDTENFEIVHTYKVYHNPNTIDLTPDDRFLFVSCRGPNDATGYLSRSPRNGQIFIMDTKKREIIAKIFGGNQPTGLDISNNGKYLVFSNFRDHNIEIYRLDRLYEMVE